MLEVALSDLPKRVSVFDAVERCYEKELRFAFARLRDEVSVLIRCEKQLIGYLQTILKRRLSTEGISIEIIDGRPKDPQQSAGGRLGVILSSLQQLVNNTETNKIFFLPYLDILTSLHQSNLTMETREIMTIIHENPMLTLVAFEDPDFKLPDLIASAFPARCEMLGIPRNRIADLISEQEARKFAVDNINLMGLYKYVSGLNPVKFREIMGIFSKKIDYDPNIADMLPNYMKELRDYTACKGAALSSIDLEKDIAGYQPVKTKIKKNILSLLQATSRMKDENAIKKIESIIPRGLIFFGPPGTGKTLFAKGIAEALNAAIYIVNGPELKSKWVGEGEANIRRLFASARATAPSVIVFDELDSIAKARSGSASDGASQAAHSMVNQLLTEMDGFNKEQMVLIIGTTNFVESLDPALLRPGRFEYQIEIPYPDWEDRKAILTLYNQKFETGLSEEQVDKLTSWTGRATNIGTPHTGDHLSAFIKDLKRFLINNGQAGATEPLLDEWLKTKTTDNKLTQDEENVVATHESGHALMFYWCNRSSEITRITLESGTNDSLGAVESTKSRAEKVITESALISEIAISLGGYCAEKIMLNEVSTGAFSDLKRATAIATDMVCAYGMGNVPREFCGDNYMPEPFYLVQLSPQIDSILNNVMKTTLAYLEKNKECLQLVCKQLQNKRTIPRDKLDEIVKPNLKLR